MPILSYDQQADIHEYFSGELEAQISPKCPLGTQLDSMCSGVYVTQNYVATEYTERQMNAVYRYRSIQRKIHALDDDDAMTLARYYVPLLPGVRAGLEQFGQLLGLMLRYTDTTTLRRIVRAARRSVKEPGSKQARQRIQELVSRAQRQLNIAQSAYATLCNRSREVQS